MFRLLVFGVVAFMFIATVRLIWTKWLKQYLEKEEILNGRSPKSSNPATGENSESES
jgi:hypothetical protein